MNSFHMNRAHTKEIRLQSDELNKEYSCFGKPLTNMAQGHSILNMTIEYTCPPISVRLVHL